MNVGIALGAQTVSDTYAATLRQDALRTLVYDITTEETITCPDQSGEAGGLWQWTIATNDATASILTYHFVCRYSDLAT